MQYVVSMLLAGARWLLSLDEDGAAESTPEPSSSPHMPTTPTVTDEVRPLIALGDDMWAEWCPCGTPPQGSGVIVQRRDGTLVAYHFECIHGG